MVQIQPRTRNVDHTDHTDDADHESILFCLRDVRDEPGIAHVYEG